MTKALPDKSRTSAFKMRKAAFMSAAATALMGAARSLYAGISVEPVTTIQAAVKDALNGQKHHGNTPVPVSAISIGNSDDIAVAADATALGHVETSEDVELVNSGNLTGGIGIEVSTGAIDLAESVFDETINYVTPGNYELLYDNAGNPVYSPYGWQDSAATAEFNYTTRTTILARDPLASTISITNSGSIDFSGRAGIKANNPAGDSITIENSGDITATQEVAGRVGIYASSESFSDTFDDELTQAGQFTRNANGQLVEVITRDQFDTYRQRIDMEYDGGEIHIHNTGDIDMGAVTGPRLYGPSSVGIYARGDGGTTIVNDGHITVDRWSSAIQVATTGALTITNNGRIDVGNGSHGMATGQSNGTAGDYRLGGDVNILNTGDIIGGLTKDQVPDGEFVFATGMNIFALGSNNEYLAGAAEANRTYAAYNEILGYEAFQLIDVPNVRLYETHVTNQGRIELQDGGIGMLVMPRAGESTATNSGTIIVGDGTSIFENNNQQSSAGIFQTNFPFNGTGLTASINTETGIIVTGDDSAGISNLNLAGISVAINEGSITTGNGVSRLVTHYTGATYDRLFHSFGVQSVSAGPMFGTYAYARNSGDISVGELAVGVLTAGHGILIVDPTRLTAIGFNEGIIETGDNSSGMLTWGTNATGLNTGSITTGNYDISAFQPHPEFTADEFAQLRFGMASSGGYLSEAINQGSITTGDGAIGVSAHLNFAGFGFGARIIQDENGVIATGDGAIGARVIGNLYAGFANDGGVSTGDDSTGVEITAGNVVLPYGDMTATIVEGTLLATNTGIIETGDNSVGVRMNGVREDLAYSGRVVLPDPDMPGYYYYHEISGTADVTSASYLANGGTIRVGANSTGVEITGTAASEQGLHLFNMGAIDASQGGTAIRVNADNELGSYIVNVGEISGDIVLGDGDDRLVHTLMVGDNGAVTSSGVITMNGSLIDFGAGENVFDIDQGTIAIAGGDNLITGADLVLNQANFEARNGIAGSTLTLDGNVSGSLLFGADVTADGDADQLLITGDVADGSDLRVILNPTEQMSGESTLKVATIGGENLGDDPLIAGITGNFADSLLGAEISYDEATGDIVVTAQFGMGHMATSAVSATTMAQNWWMQAVGSFDKRNLQKLAGAEDTGVSVWAAAFHEEGTYEPGNDLQDTSFDQKLSGLQTGVEWQKEVAGGSFTLGAMFSQGDASVNLNANVSSAVGSASAYGVNASYSFKNGLYVNAAWQTMSMDVNLRTPGTFSAATGSTQAEGDGFNVEMGYAHRFGSGLTLLPQLQYASVDVELDDFSSSDDVYGLTEVGGRHSLLRAGVSLLKTFETTNGSITPVLDLSWLDALDGDSGIRSNGLQFTNDTSGSGLRAEFGIAGRYKAWDISGRVGLTDTQKSKQSLSTNLNVRYRW